MHDHAIQFCKRPSLTPQIFATTRRILPQFHNSIPMVFNKRLQQTDQRTSFRCQISQRIPTHPQICPKSAYKQTNPRIYGIDKRPEAGPGGGWAGWTRPGAAPSLFTPGQFPPNITEYLGIMDFNSLSDYWGYYTRVFCNFGNFVF